MQAHLLSGLSNLVHGLLGGFHRCELVSVTAQGAHETEEKEEADNSCGEMVAFCDQREFNALITTELHSKQHWEYASVMGYEAVFMQRSISVWIDPGK